MTFATIGLAIASTFWPASAWAGARHGHDCRAVVAAKEKIVVCKTNFYRLNAADRPDEKYVEITGFLHRSEGRYYIFSSQDAYKYSAGRGGVYLEVDAEQARGFEAEFGQYDGAVSVVGWFSRDRRAGASESLGRLKVLGSMFWRQEFPGEKPALPNK